MAIIVYMQCIQGTLGREIIRYTVTYGVYIRFWPTLNILQNSVDRHLRISTVDRHLSISQVHKHTEPHTRTNIHTLIHTHLVFIEAGDVLLPFLPVHRTVNAACLVAQLLQVRLDDVQQFGHLQEQTERRG